MKRKMNIKRNLVVGMAAAVTALSLTACNVPNDQSTPSGEKPSDVVVNNEVKSPK